MLHHSEWLHEAQSVPVGQKRRFYHGAEPTAALDCYNNVDSWSAYCHRCKVTGYVRKEFLAKVDVTQPIYRKYLPKNLRTIGSLDEVLVVKIVLMLHSKGVSLNMLQRFNPMYSPDDQRLVFKFKGVHVGRDVTGVSPQKWFIYHNDNPMSYVYLQGKSESVKRKEYVVLTEDLFSAIKVQEYTGLNTLWNMGTNFKDSTFSFITDKHVIVFTDGDKAGADCSSTISRRCKIFDIPCTVVQTKEGYDPKDYKGSELREVLHAFLPKI